MKIFIVTLIAVLAFGVTQVGFAAEAQYSIDSVVERSLTREERRARRAERRAERRAARRAERRQARSVPELDGGYAVIALGLVGGVVLVKRERRRRRVA